MPTHVTHECKACGDIFTFRLKGKTTIWDHGFSAYHTCGAIHYVCRPCLERLGLLGYPYRLRPCFGSDEFRAAAAAMFGGP